MAVRRPRRLFRWTTITPCVVVALLVVLSLLLLLSLCAFATMLLLLPVVLLWLSPAAVPLCFEMREPTTVDVCFGKKRLSKGSIAYTWKGVGSVFHGDDGDGSRKKWLRVSTLDGAILREGARGGNAGQLKGYGGRGGRMRLLPTPLTCLVGIRRLLRYVDSFGFPHDLFERL